MFDINAIINDAIAKAVESHIGEISARYAARISELALQVTNLQDEVDSRANQMSCIEDDLKRLSQQVYEALGDEYLKKCDFSEQLQECLESEITLKVTVE